MVVEKSSHAAESFCGDRDINACCLICIQQPKQERGGIGLWEWSWCKGNCLLWACCPGRTWDASAKDLDAVLEQSDAGFLLCALEIWKPSRGGATHTSYFYACSSAGSLQQESWRKQKILCSMVRKSLELAVHCALCPEPPSCTYPGMGYWV